MTDDSFKRYLLNKQIKFLRDKKGFHTELITLMIPPERKLSDVSNYLKNEINESSNIKSKLTRKNVIDSITALIQKLKTIKSLPPNGLILYSGAIPQGNSPGTEKNELYIVEPIEPVSNFKYYCSSEFLTEPLENMLTEKQLYGLIVIDNKEAAIGWVKGTHMEVVKTTSSGVSSQHRAGGQSQRRFERLHDEGIAYFLKRVGELSNEIFLPLEEEGTLEGIFIGGAGQTKNKFADGDHFDYRLRDKILDVVDIGVGGAEGIRDLLYNIQDKIEDVRYVKEKNLMQRFLYNLSKDTGLVTYGEKEVRIALERAAVETLLLSEALDAYRVKVLCEQCGNTVSKTVKEADLPTYRDIISKESCEECKSSLYSIEEELEIIEDLAILAENTGASVEMISSETEEGETLWSTFGGIAAILRFRTDL
ncbi:MAG: peptide chain release factor aRF-1 [Candidatus Lokiarchaeota archaeon]|nr:peptide chain release factor aRF-1 [Candidatus Lokiarchaeota archaeon]